LWAAILPVAVEHTSHADSDEEHGHGNAEPIVIKRMAVHEKLAQEMRASGIECDVLPLGSHQLERQETYYSHSFALTPRLVTNRGLISVVGKNIDFVQVLQRN
jgi:hypothetical protein